MKKLFALVLALAMVLSLAACGAKAEAPAAAPAAPAADAAAPAEGGVTGDKFTISLVAGSIGENTPTGGALKEMAAFINENSNGTIVAETFFDTALGDATSMVQGLQQGTVDIGVSGTAYFSGLIPEIEVFQLPFLFGSLEEARVATAGPAADAINTKFHDVGIVGLSFWENGFRELTNNVRPVKTPADLNGIKMRTLPSEIQVECWKAMGALPTTIDAAELYTALQQGTVSAQDNPLHEIVSRKFYEVQPYITLTDAVYTPFYMAMSKITWDAMSESQQALIVEAAAVGRAAQHKLNEEATAAATQVLLDAGCTIEENPDKAAFQEVAMSVWPLFTDKYGTELLDMIQK